MACLSSINIDTETKRKLYKMSTVLGTLMMLLPNGTAMYWGNLAVYVNSYIVVCLEITSGVQEPWVVSMYVLFWSLGVMAYDAVTRRVGRRWTAVLGALFTDLGIFCSYISVQHSFVLFNLTFAVGTGIGTGFLQAHGLRLLVDWADNDTGLLVAIMQGAFNWGASSINQIVTLYLNPSNDLPDVKIESSVYFTKKRVLDSVPSVFLVLGCFAVVSHIIGFLLLRDNTFSKATLGNVGEEECDVTTESTAVCENQENGYSSLSRKTENENCTSNGSIEMIKVTEENEKTETPDIKAESLTKSMERDFTPKEVLRSATFYIMWVVFFFAEYPFMILSNYYKSFGQIYIHDDHFLTNLGTVLSLTVIVMRIFWGLGMDKVGARNCLVLEIILVIFVTMWYFFTAIVNKWFYFIITNVYSALSAALFSSIALTVVSLFGKTHFSTNYGYLRSSSIILSVACPFLTEAILDYLGWFYIFGFAGIINAIGLILILFFVPSF